MTFVYVTHDQEEALAISDAIVVLHDGRVEQYSTPRELYDEPQTLFAATFIGDANVLPCTIRRWGASRVEVDVDGLAVSARCAPGVDERSGTRLCLRPERVRVGDLHGAHTATVTDVVFAGARIRYWLYLTPTVTLVAEGPVAPGQPLLAIGTRTTVGWDSDAAVIFAA